jgi:4a-hydroxytetrahydrobiopterin dehydratase
MDADADAVDSTETLTRQTISDAVSDLGWRLVLGVLRCCVPVVSLAQAAAVAEAVTATHADVGDHLWVDLRRDRVILTVQTLATASTTHFDIELARQISTAIGGMGLATVADVDGRALRSVQVLELAIDALDIAAIRPFWKAVMGYVDEPGHSGPTDPLVDPLAQGPAIWFQQMDAPRSQRNRIHLDVSVPHDEAATRIRAALEAGGTLRYDAEAPAFWVLADAEGNEACVTTWQGRD